MSTSLHQNPLFSMAHHQQARLSSFHAPVKLTPSHSQSQSPAPLSPTTHSNANTGSPIVRPVPRIHSPHSPSQQADSPNSPSPQPITDSNTITINTTSLPFVNGLPSATNTPSHSNVINTIQPNNNGGFYFPPLVTGGASTGNTAPGSPITHNSNVANTNANSGAGMPSFSRAGSTEWQNMGVINPQSYNALSQQMTSMWNQSMLNAAAANWQQQQQQLSGRSSDGKPMGMPVMYPGFNAGMSIPTLPQLPSVPGSPSLQYRSLANVSNSNANNVSEPVSRIASPSLDLSNAAMLNAFNPFGGNLPFSPSTGNMGLSINGLSSPSSLMQQNQQFSNMAAFSAMAAANAASAASQAKARGPSSRVTQSHTAVFENLLKMGFDSNQMQAFMAQTLSNAGVAGPMMVNMANMAALASGVTGVTDPAQAMPAPSGQRRNKSQRVYRCTNPGCNETLKTRFSLKRHMKKHTGEKPHTCPYAGCMKSFPEASTLKRHVRIHTGEKPFKCKFINCNKAFADATNVKRHEMTHTGEKPYKCFVDQCFRSFSRGSSLKQHMISLHKLAPDNPLLNYSVRRGQAMKSGNLEGAEEQELKAKQEAMVVNGEGVVATGADFAGGTDASGVPLAQVNGEQQGQTQSHILTAGMNAEGQSVSVTSEQQRAMIHQQQQQLASLGAVKSEPMDDAELDALDADLDGDDDDDDEVDDEDGDDDQ